MDVISDSYEKIPAEQGKATVKQGTRIMEVSSPDSDTFTIYEKIRGGYIGHLKPMADNNDEEFYEIDPETVAEDTFWPVGASQESAEIAILPLLNAGWEIAYYDAEHADMRIHDLMRD